VAGGLSTWGLYLEIDRNYSHRPTSDKTHTKIRTPTRYGAQWHLELIAIYTFRVLAPSLIHSLPILHNILLVDDHHFYQITPPHSTPPQGFHCVPPERITDGFLRYHLLPQILSFPRPRVIRWHLRAGLNMSRVPVSPV
jgi:hypothetical protein